MRSIFDITFFPKKAKAFISVVSLQIVCLLIHYQFKDMFSVLQKEHCFEMRICHIQLL